MYRQARVTISTFVAFVLLLGTAAAAAEEGAPPASLEPLAPLGTAFTYQGQLNDSGSPYAGTCDFELKLFDALTNGTLVGTQNLTGVTVNQGLFTVAPDFGPGAFAGSARWLELTVRCPATTGTWVKLTPRQAVTAAPYALYATSAPWSGLVGVPAGFADGVDNDTTYTAGTGLTLGGSEFSLPVSYRLPQGCSRGEVARWNASPPGWQCYTEPAVPPVAILKAIPPEVYLANTATATVQLSMTLSYDPAGTNLTYAFDPTGTATEAPASYGASATYSAEYTGTGEYLAAGWARNTGGDVDMAQAKVSIRQFAESIAASGISGYTTAAVVGGRPAILYVVGEAVKYTRAMDATGLQWEVPRTVTSHSGWAYAFTSMMAVGDEGVGAAFYESTNADLLYARSNSYGYFLETVTVVSTGNVGSYASLALVNGRPAIAYYDATNGDLCYVRAAEATGSTWSARVVVASAGSVGQFASLVVVNGRPAIAYYDQTNADLKYVRAADADGNNWGVPVTVDANSAGQFADLAVVNGRPAIAYYRDDAAGYLKFVRASDVNGAAWGTPLTVDSEIQAGSYGISMAVIAGRPAIVSESGWTMEVHYIAAADADGTAWDAPFTLDNWGGWSISDRFKLIEVSGRPGLAFTDNDHQQQRFMYPRL